MAHQQSTDHELNARLLRYRSKPESQDPLALAEALLSARRYGDARGVAVSAQPDDSGDARLLLLEGQAWLLEGHLDRALDKFTAAAALQPDEAAHYQWLGRALQLRGDPLRAVHALSRAMELKPESEETRQALTAAQEALAEAEARKKRPEPELAAPEAEQVDPSAEAPELPVAVHSELHVEPEFEAEAEHEVEPQLKVEPELEVELEREVEPQLKVEPELEVEPERDEEAKPEVLAVAPLTASAEPVAAVDTRPAIDQTQSFETDSEDEVAQHGENEDAVAAADESPASDAEVALEVEEPVSETSPGLGPMTVAEEDALWAPTSTTSAFGDIDSPQASISASGDLDAPTMRSSAGDLDSPLGDWFSSEEDDALLTEESEDVLHEASAEPQGLSDLLPSVELGTDEADAAPFESKDDPFTAALHALHAAQPSLPLVFDAVPSTDEPAEATAALQEGSALPVERSPEGVFGRQADDALNLPVAWDGPVVGAFSDSHAPGVQRTELLELSEALEPEDRPTEVDGDVEEARATEGLEAVAEAVADDAELAEQSDEALFDDEHGDLARTFFEAEPELAYEGEDDAVPAERPEAPPVAERPVLSLRPVEVTRKAPARKGRVLPVVASVALVAACAAGGYVVTRANMEGKGADEVLAQLASRAPTDLSVQWTSLQGSARAVSARALGGLQAAREGLTDMLGQGVEETQLSAAAEPLTAPLSPEPVAEGDVVEAASESEAPAEIADEGPPVEAAAEVAEAPVQAQKAEPAALGAQVGLARLSKGDVDGARAVLQQLSATARKEEAGLLLRAELEILDGRPQRALHTLRDLRGSDQRSTALLNTIGRALYALDEVDRAAGAFDLALGQAPSNVTAMVGRAEVHLRAERSEDAIALLERARAARGEATEAQRAQLLTLLGHAYLQREVDGDRELAYAVLRSAVALPSAPAEAYFWLGESLAGRRTSEATSAYTTYLERAPQGRYAERARRALGPLL